MSKKEDFINEVKKFYDNCDSIIADYESQDDWRAEIAAEHARNLRGSNKRETIHNRDSLMGYYESKDDEFFGPDSVYDSDDDVFKLILMDGDKEHAQSSESMTSKERFLHDVDEVYDNLDKYVYWLYGLTDKNSVADYEAIKDLCGKHTADTDRIHRELIAYYESKDEEFFKSGEYASDDMHDHIQTMRRDMIAAGINEKKETKKEHFIGVVESFYDNCYSIIQDLEGLNDWRANNDYEMASDLCGNDDAEAEIIYSGLIAYYESKDEEFFESDAAYMSDDLHEQLQAMHRDMYSAGIDVPERVSDKDRFISGVEQFFNTHNAADFEDEFFAEDAARLLGDGNEERKKEIFENLHEYYCEQDKDIFYDKKYADCDELTTDEYIWLLLEDAEFAEAV